MSSDTRAERSKAFSWALSARAMHDAGTSPEGTPRAYRSENAAFPGAGSADDASRDLAHAPSSRRRLIVGQAYHQGNCGTTPTRVESFLDGPSLRHAVHMRVLWLAAALLGICACALMRRPSQDEGCLDLDAHCHAILVRAFGGRPTLGTMGTAAGRRGRLDAAWPLGLP